MAAINSTVLACSHVISAPSMAGIKLVSTSTPSAAPICPSSIKSPSVRAQKSPSIEPKEAGEGRRAALVGLAAVVFSASVATATSSANAGIIEEYLERSKANKELNDQKRLATSGANLARAYTVEFGTCKFPENFTGCQDLAKQKKVKFLTEDLELECQGKDKYKCGSNVFWKW
ncbi:photosystem I reaction center subunit N, chloroplastic [Phalaenopsis equestris]|uniref:photosystem I reaction center subunit N, chloroplastic n=1 Tax=Phalaenopsis equestris TaxID=78828 RepID=UPI0009E480AC|nr:photosystem I reaction center subunit N, chloroplastic [Phalaenopsis equestris]